MDNFQNLFIWGQPDLGLKSKRQTKANFPAELYIEF